MIDIGKVRQNHKPRPSFSDITAVIFVRYRPNLTTGTMDPIKYIAQNRRDRDWGLTVCSVGHQRISPGEDYPPRKHNQEYMFDPAQGRILPEYQLLYIVEGKGIFRTGSAGDMKVAAGDMFIIFPGEWHSYMPDPDTGWNEYWIGFQGVNIDHRVETGFFSPASPLFHIGYNEFAVNLYNEAIRTATRQEPYFQQLLAGIVNHLLGLMFMTGTINRRSRDGDTARLIDMAKNIMGDSLEEDISMPGIAERLSIGYTKFRRLFKQYTGQSPAQYFINMKIHRAKEMLRGSSASVKEIAFTLHFESAEYFATTFKTRTGMTPTQFRSI